MATGKKEIVIPALTEEEIIEKSIRLTDRYLTEERWPSHQSVFKGVAEVFAVSYPPEALRLLSGFTAGGGFTGHLCGALCGGIALLGYIYGSGEPMPEEKYSAFVAAITAEGKTSPQKIKAVLDSYLYPSYIFNLLINRFRQEYGHCNCAELISPFADDLVSRRRFGTCRRIVRGTAGLVSGVILGVERGQITPALGENIYSNVLSAHESQG